jgi:hypothetical protein
MVGSRPPTLPAPMIELDALFRSDGSGPSGTAGPGELAGDDGLEEDGDGEGEGDAEVTATVSAAAGGVHFTVVTMLAVAVSFTELTEVALPATAIWALRATGCLSVTALTVQEAGGSSLAQPLVNVGFWLVGCEASVTVTSEAEPFTVEIVTAYPAFCPRWTLDCERLTVTHSWVCELELGLGLGLPMTSAAREAAVAEAVAEAEADAADWDGDEEAEADADAEPDSAAEADGEADGDWLGLPPWLLPVPAELVEGEGEGDGEGDVEEGEGEGDGEGLGEGVPADGSAWHVVAVSLAAAARTASAWAVPGRAVSPTKSTKLPASKLAAPVRTCLKRMLIACSGWLATRCGFGGDLVVDGHEYSYPRAE